jgi:hypothetical protein
MNAPVALIGDGPGPAGVGGGSGPGRQVERFEGAGMP